MKIKMNKTLNNLLNIELKHLFLDSNAFKKKKFGKSETENISKWNLTHTQYKILDNRLKLIQIFLCILVEDDLKEIVMEQNLQKGQYFIFKFLH